VRAETFADGSRHEGLGTLYASDTRARPAGTIRLTTLDAFVSERDFARVDGIKLDIEGAELAALRGAATTIERFRPWLIIEIGEETCGAAGYEPAAILDFLDRLGYDCRRIGRKGKLQPATQDTTSSWQNVLCRPRSPR